MNLTLRVAGVEREPLLEAVQADPQVVVLHVWERPAADPR